MNTWHPTHYMSAHESHTRRRRLVKFFPTKMYAPSRICPGAHSAPAVAPSVLVGVRPRRSPRTAGVAAPPLHSLAQRLGFSARRSG